MGSDTTLESDHGAFLKYKGDRKFDSNKRHKCTYEGCNAVFNRPWRLERHTYSHTKERPFKCGFPGCSKDYMDKTHLKRHILNIHCGKRPRVYIPCSFPGCNKVYSNNFNLRRHIFDCHKNKNSYQCEMCDHKFRKRRTLKSHLFNHLGIHLYSCNTCYKPFNEWRVLKQHEKIHKFYYCPHEGCDENFNTWNKLRQHIRIIHPKSFTCDSCGKVYKNKYILTEHVLTHLPIEKRHVILCPHAGCDRSYFYRRNLNHHLRSFHQDILYRCNYENCGKSFAARCSLKSHKKTHTEPLPYELDPKNPKKPRKPRKDKGLPKKSMAAKLSGIILPSNIDKNLAQSNITPEVLECIESLKEALCSNENSSEGVKKALCSEETSSESVKEALCSEETSSEYVNEI